MTVRHLLEHSSGLAAWRAYHDELAAHAGGAWLKTRRAKQAVRRMVTAERLVTPPGARAEYSDLGFILLEWILERLSNRPLHKLFSRRLAGRLPRGRLFFIDLVKGRKPKGAVFAASERCPWRGQTLSGEVHDDNTWAVGGVSGQAGLFGDARGVAAMATCWLDSFLGRATFFHRDLVRLFFRRSKVPGSHRALGFDTPSRGCSAGRRLGPGSVGHTGFTGTSLWIDPKRELIVVLLTNRVHPTRDNLAIQAFRPGLHDLVVECLGAQKR
jgi:CubicO group peptidase (beta-lactamase class C family)